MAGNLLNDGNHTYTYDAENRLATVDGGATATYVYDAFGKRVEKTVSGLSHEYIYDNEGHINTVLGNGMLERMYVYLNGQPLAEYFENTTYFVHSDHLGSTRLLTRLDQTVRESDDYYPFGELIPPTGGTGGTLKFTGKERDSESGLDNFGARYDSSSLGRFMTPDPGNAAAHRTNPQSWNAYSYAHNRPLTLVDPNGLEPVKAQAGTIHGFAQSMNNTPHHVGQTTGADAAHALQSLGETSGFGPKNTAVFNMSANRYVYTANGGWVDMVHFVFYAGRAATDKAEGGANPVGSAVQEGFHQELMDTFKAPWSAYSYEDLPSDRLGAIFGAQYFDPTSSLTLAEQMELFFELYLVPMPATSAPNYANLPMKDSRNAPTATNRTTNPMYTYSWSSAQSTRRSCVTAAGETTCENY